MTLPFLPPVIRDWLFRHRPLLVYATVWTALLTTVVAAASFAPQAAFVLATRPSARGCEGGAVRVLLDGPPGEVVCLPRQLLGTSKLDFVVPPVFAAMVVAGSACFVRAVWFGTPA